MKRRRKLESIQPRSSFFVQVLADSFRHKVGVIDGRRDTHAVRCPETAEAELVREFLQAAKRVSLGGIALVACCCGGCILGPNSRLALCIESLCARRQDRCSTRAGCGLFGWVWARREVIVAQKDVVSWSLSCVFQCLMTHRKPFGPISRRYTFIHDSPRINPVCL